MCPRNLHTIANRKRHTFQHRLGQRGTRGVHPQPDERTARGRIVVGAAFAHQVGQEVDVVRAQLVRRNGCLLGSVVSGVQHFFAPPLVAGRSRKDAAHQMIPSVRVGEAVQGVLLVDAERIAGDEHRARCAQGNIALTAAHRAAADSRSGVIARARANDHISRQAQRLGGFGSQRADGLPALKQLRQLGFLHAADVQHFLAPAFVLHVQQQHARCVGIVGAVDAGQLIVDVILRQHDFFDAGEVVRLVLPHPKQFGCGEACKGDVCGVTAQLVFADNAV